MKPLSKGDTCRVRLHAGEAVDAVYDRVAYPSFEKAHWVTVNGLPCYASSGAPHPENQFDHACVRFIGPSCVLLPVGVSV